MYDKSITTKEADKRGAVVKMDTDYYKNRILEMLNNINYYEPARYEQCLLDDEIDYLKNYQHRPSYFYGLSKVNQFQKQLRINYPSITLYEDR